MVYVPGQLFLVHLLQLTGWVFMLGYRRANCQGSRLCFFEAISPGLKPSVNMLLAMLPEPCRRPRAPSESIPPSKLHMCKLRENCNFALACGLKCGICV